jgi:hypothetical protein
MKKHLLFLCSLLCIATTQAQTAFWSEDFHAGMPAGWTNTGVDGNNTPVSGMWKYTTTGSHGLYSGNSVLLSPTQANGYILFDSDSLDTGGPGGTSGSGPAEEPQTGNLTTSTINCLGHSQIYLEFYQYYSAFDATTRVIVDNGTTADTFLVNNDLPPVATIFTTDPSLRHIDISATAGNRPSVKITFQWLSGSYYFWMIDDVKLLDAPANDLKLTYAASYDYSIYPISQLDSIRFEGKVKNTGTSTQPNTKINLDISYGGNTLFSGASTGLSMPYGIDSPLYGANTWAPTAPQTGTYSVVMTATSANTDAYPFDNADTSTFQFSDSVYASDNGVYGGAFYVINQSANYEWLNVFEIKQQDTITSITTSLAGGVNGTDIGSVIQGRVYSLDPQTFTPVNIINTEERTISTADIDTASNVIKPLTLLMDYATASTLDVPILQPGLYGVSIAGISSPGNIIIHSTTKRAPGSLSGYFDNNSSNNTPFSFFDNANMYIRANFGNNPHILHAGYTRTPPGAMVSTGSPVTFYGVSNASAAATFRWDILDSSGVYLPSQFGATITQTFSLAGSYTVVLIVTDGNDSVKVSKPLTVVSVINFCTANFSIAPAGAPHTYTLFNNATGNNLQYHWTFGDGDSSLIIYPTHTYDSAGVYTICLTVRDTIGGCTASYCDSNQYLNKSPNSVISVTVVPGTTGIDQPINDLISLCPNPVHDVLTLRATPQMIGSSYNLTDVTGRELNKGLIVTEQTHINTTDLAAGVYFVHLSGRTERSYKVIKN